MRIKTSNHGHVFDFCVLMLSYYPATFRTVGRAAYPCAACSRCCRSDNAMRTLYHDVATSATHAVQPGANGGHAASVLALVI